MFYNACHSSEINSLKNGAQWDHFSYYMYILSVAADDVALDIHMEEKIEIPKSNITYNNKISLRLLVKKC